MPETIGSSLEMLLVTVMVLALLLWPAIMAWYALSIRRQLVRIADALEVRERSASAATTNRLNDLTPFEEAKLRGVANSAFGR